jgi:phosphoenolpyruvate carboxylase
MSKSYRQAVSTRYHIYNSLFLNLPYSGIYRTGTLLPLLHQYSEEGFEDGKDPNSIVRKFFRDFVPKATRQEQLDLLFGFIQYAERQVVLFDSIEDAAFEEINDMTGKGTISALLLRASSEGLVEELKRKLQDFSVRVVLTAHPTQFYPGNVLAIINDLEEAIREGQLENINLLLRQLGKTAFLNRQKPTPYDEAVSLSWYLENVFYHAIPGIIIKLLEGLNINPDSWKNYDLIKIGFWPGGDRDGNPFVTHDITIKVAKRLRDAILKCYTRDLRQLRRRLTFKGVDTIIQQVERKVYAMAYEQETGDTYKTQHELLDDLGKAKKILVDDHKGLFLNLLDAFIIKVKIFGFNFASMDIRQDSRKHAYVWDSIFKQLEGKQKKL